MADDQRRLDLLGPFEREAAKCRIRIAGRRRGRQVREEAGEIGSVAAQDEVVDDGQQQRRVVLLIRRGEHQRSDLCVAGNATCEPRVQRRPWQARAFEVGEAAQ